ncbi:hypothetical protein HDE_05904 [Halotydeus destructor]|nr:hypothetical protein HDE_05904 [Halotydeus destructor]
MIARAILYLHVVHLAIRVSKNVNSMVKNKNVDAYLYAFLYMSSLSGKLMMRNVAMKLEAISQCALSSSRCGKQQMADIVKFTRLVCLMYLAALLVIVTTYSTVLATESFDDVLANIYGTHLKRQDIAWYHYLAYLDYILLMCTGYTWLVFVTVSFLSILKITHTSKLSQVRYVNEMIRKPLDNKEALLASYRWKTCIMAEKQVTQIYAPHFVSYTFWLFLYYCCLVVFLKTGFGATSNPTVYRTIKECICPALHTLFFGMIIMINFKFNRKLSQLVDSCASEYWRQSPESEEDTLALIDNITQDWVSQIEVFSLYSINLGFVLKFVSSIIPLAIMILNMWSTAQLLKKTNYQSGMYDIDTTTD